MLTLQSSLGAPGGMLSGSMLARHYACTCGITAEDDVNSLGLLWVLPSDCCLDVYVPAVTDVVLFSRMVRRWGTHWVTYTVYEYTHTFHFHHPLTLTTCFNLKTYTDGDGVDPELGANWLFGWSSLSPKVCRIMKSQMMSLIIYQHMEHDCSDSQFLLWWPSLSL